MITNTIIGVAVTLLIILVAFATNSIYKIVTGKKLF